MRMVRSGPWDDNVLIDEMSRDVLNWLPAPADGVIHLSAALYVTKNLTY